MQDNIFAYKDNFQEIRSIGHKELINNTTSDPLITICIPTYKRDPFLEVAVKSVWEQSCQISYEILICDNQNDRHDLPDFLLRNSTNVRYLINNSNLGMVGNWNKLILEAKGKCLFFVHDDDWLDKDFFLTTKDFLGRDEAISIHYQVKDFREKPLKRNVLKPLLKKILKSLQPSFRRIYPSDIFFSPVSPAIFARKKLIELGGYNSDHFPAIDGVIYCKYILSFGGVQLKQLLYNYRIQINESMKSEVFNGFLDKYRLLRTEIAKHAMTLKFLLPHSSEFDRLNLDRNWGKADKLKVFSMNYWLFILFRLLREALIIMRVI